MTCDHDERAVCWLCDWNTQPWWPEARQRALDTHRITPDDLTWQIRRRMWVERQTKLVHG